MARKRKETKNQCKGTELDVFKDRAGRANLAIFEALAKTSPQNIKQILKQISRYKGLEETYYASLTKRLRALREAGYIKETKTTQEDTKAQTSYELNLKPTSPCYSKKTPCKTYSTKPQTHKQPQSCYRC